MDAVGTGRAAACRSDGAAPVGVYKPRRAQGSPLFRLVNDQFRTLQMVYDERFAPTYGAWRAVVPQVADKFLACGVLEHGFARVRCDACAHEYLLAFSCKARYFCPSCHAKRLALWTLWLEETLLAAVPHRQVVLTIPKRLRTWCLYRRALLGDLARVAARTVTAAIRTLTCEPDLAVGVIACIQTHGSLANWHPHIHMIVTGGGFRTDGTFLPWPAHDTAALTEAFRRAVLRLFVRRGIFEADDAEGMLAWPHSGFHVHDGVCVADGDLDFAKRLARYCARNPVALDRLQYDGPATSVQYRSDKRAGPTAGTETVDPLEFLARRCDGSFFPYDESRSVWGRCCLSGSVGRNA
ncbi:MAG: IS91 family transposase [Gemmatimonadaceae bacterium]